MSLEKLVRLSHRYGQDKNYVIAGGGNTSWKNEEHMYVKGSGTELAAIKAQGFVKMDLQKLNTIWSHHYPADEGEREEQVLTDLMNSRYPSEQGKRPSVESLLHALIPSPYVVHTHPALVNGLTCSKQGEETVRELFGGRAVWIPVTNPGYVLAKTVSDRVKRHTGGREFPRIIFLQNHGIFVAGASGEEIDGIYEEIFEKIREKVQSYPSDDAASLEESEVAGVREVLESALKRELAVFGFVNPDILEFARSEEMFAPLSLALTPDHIVYYGFKPVYAETLSSLGQSVRDFTDENGSDPRLAVVRDLGAFSFHPSPSMAEKGKHLFVDDVNIAVYVKSFGGHQFMPQDKIDFIRNWEAEKYRASLSK